MIIFLKDFMYLNLRKNQINAIDISLKNDFKSGIHAHSTGSGKSYIAIEIVKKYNNIYKNNNIIWICERKDILKHQFSKKILEERGFTNILNLFNFYDFVNNKDNDWFHQLNNNINKPYLCIINRSFLCRNNNYENINNIFSLVIHDECHSIENKTTSDFYKWFLKLNNNLKVIGFSATPELIYPLNNILTEYNIYDSYIDNITLPPKIVWIKNEFTLDENDYLELVKNEINKLYYKKIIIWCGIIDECIKLANLWKNHFKDFNICIDFNNKDKYNIYNFNDFETFYNNDYNSLLFCAVKHREGSDIPNLDGCIFMDMVDKRSERVFNQSIGRVLRVDKLKKKIYGLVIDFRAISTVDIINRIKKYLNNDIFPWVYDYENILINNKKIIVNNILMTKNVITEDNSVNINENISLDELKNYFIRKIIDRDDYKIRLNKEYQLIKDKKLFNDLFRARQILDFTKNIPHVTRGSSGSSLICYLLGITHVDPIKYNISFSRFINEFRDNLPDIDFDFPHYLRDEVFLKLYQIYGKNIARISNHNYYHDKSALRKSIKINGYNKFISKYDINKYLKNVDQEKLQNIKKIKNELEGQFKGYSLHCGGIIYYPNGIPEEEKLDHNRRTIINQVCLNKYDVSENKNFKIDILSSRALSQLYYTNNFNNIDFYSNINDKKTIDLLSSGNNIGLTLAETPLIRKAFCIIKPKSIYDIALCLAIIRPASNEARKNMENIMNTKDNIIFDDDAIYLISNILNCSEGYADKIRRSFCKNDKDTLEIINKYIESQNCVKKKKLTKILNDLKKYSFCKAHAISYAQLVWQLAYNKAHNPKRFWESTLLNIQTSYKKWVHIHEAQLNDVDINKIFKSKSVYGIEKIKKQDKNISNIESLKKYGYFFDSSIFDLMYINVFDNNSADFKGIIANSKIIGSGKNRKLILFVAVKKDLYLDIEINGNFYYNNTFNIITGTGYIYKKFYSTIICGSINVKFT